MSRYLRQTLHGSPPKLITPVRFFTEYNLVIVLNYEAYLVILKEISHLREQKEPFGSSDPEGNFFFDCAHQCLAINRQELVFERVERIIINRLNLCYWRLPSAEN